MRYAKKYIVRCSSRRNRGTCYFRPSIEREDGMAFSVTHAEYQAADVPDVTSSAVHAEVIDMALDYLGSKTLDAIIHRHRLSGERLLTIVKDMAPSGAIVQLLK